MRLKLMYKIIKRTGLSKMFTALIIVFLIASLLIMVVEPHINNYLDAMWYTFVAATSIGFGDICPETHIGRIITVLMTLYAIIVAAMIPGVIVTYYTEYIKVKEKETISAFMEKLERLPELSNEDLISLSERVKQFNKK